MSQIVSGKIDNVISFAESLIVSSIKVGKGKRL